MTTSSDASRARLRKVSFDEAVSRGKATFSEWGKPLAPAQFLERERRLLSVPWARKTVSTWFLEDEVGACLSSCETFRVESRFDGRPGISHGIASVFTESPLRGRGHAARLLELLHEKLLEPESQSIYLFSDIDPAYYERLGYRALPAMDRVYAPEAGDPFQRAQAAASESFLGIDWGSLRRDSRFLVPPSDGFLDWQLERERAYASLLARERPPRGGQGARVGGSFLLWSANFRYDELFALAFHAESAGDAEILVQSGCRMAARLGLRLFRAWEDSPGSLFPQGGLRQARSGSVPMLRGIAPGLESADWNWIPRAVWL